MRICWLLLIVLNFSCAKKDEKFQSNTNTKTTVSTENNNEDDTLEKPETGLGVHREGLQTGFDNCRMRAIDEKEPHYINVCKTYLGEMHLDDYLRFLDTGVDTLSDLELFDERDFLPESDYPTREVTIDSARLRESIQRIAQLGRVSDSEEMIRAREHSNRIDRINEHIRQINAAREQLIEERDSVAAELEHMYRLRRQLRSPNLVVRGGTAFLMRAQSSKKEFAGEFGQRHLALKNKFKAVRVEDIKSI